MTARWSEPAAPGRRRGGATPTRRRASRTAPVGWRRVGSSPPGSGTTAPRRSPSARTEAPATAPWPRRHLAQTLHGGAPTCAPSGLIARGLRRSPRRSPQPDAAERPHGVAPPPTSRPPRSLTRKQTTGTMSWRKISSRGGTMCWRLCRNDVLAALSYHAQRALGRGVQLRLPARSPSARQTT